MLAKTAKGTYVSVDFMPDTEENLGGYYCTITLYDGEYGEIIGDTFDDFCIGTAAYRGGKADCNLDDWGAVEKYARKYVESITDY